MDILKMMEDVKVKFEQAEEAIKTRQAEINSIVDEQKRLQGEYRVLFQLAENQKVIDIEGNVLKKTKEEVNEDFPTEVGE